MILHYSAAEPETISWEWSGPNPDTWAAYASPGPPELGNELWQVNGDQRSFEDGGIGQIFIIGLDDANTFVTPPSNSVNTGD